MDAGIEQLLVEIQSDPAVLVTLGVAMTMPKRFSPVLCLMVGALSALPAQPVAAFCGFYAASADSKLYANASMVVLMRQGTRTVLSMQNNYQGPAAAFALVIPVPSVLRKEQVKTLPKSVFERVDALGAPRLVEYWEADPCRPPIGPDDLLMATAASYQSATTAGEGRGVVKVEAKFTVAEYDIVVLSANDSAALERWLTANRYNIPKGAARILAPYVAAGTKFFVAKVDPKRVTFAAGQALLSPLRFYYDSPEFSLPVRLGLLNSQGQQDLIVNILSETRYELANYPNTTIPTNIVVDEAVRADFGAFYEAQFARALKDKPGAVITEYAWDASTCDPCPTPPLSDEDLLTLGADVVGKPRAYTGRTLTRLHYRYTAQTLGEDLVFRRAPALEGGRGMPSLDGKLANDVLTTRDMNNFQGRYAILHPWTGDVKCKEPVRGSWGGGPQVQIAKNTALTGKTKQPVRTPAPTPAPAKR